MKLEGLVAIDTHVHVESEDTSNAAGEAARKYFSKPAADIPWTTKIELRGVMDLIGVSDVTAKLDAVMADRAKMHR